MSGLPLNNTVCSYTTIEMDGKPFKVRTFTVGGDSDGTKKTLVFTHGYIGPTVFYMHALARLSEKYRLVLFDNCCKGLNTKLEEWPPSVLDPETAEQWLLTFMVRTIDALDLPSRFLLAGHSYGGYLVALYASQRPERVESLFLVSPAFMEPFDEARYDPTSFSDPKDPRQRITLARVAELDQ